MSFCEQLHEAGTPRETKADVTAYYKARYPGVRTDSKGRTIAAWRSKATTEYARVTGLSRASAAREFQGVRGASSGKKNAAIWKRIGKDLPPAPPENGYRIRGVIWVKYSDDCEERHIDETITGKAARALSLMECDDATQAVANYYQHDDIDEEGPAWCAEPQLTVTAR